MKNDELVATVKGFVATVNFSPQAKKKLKCYTSGTQTNQNRYISSALQGEIIWHLHLLCMNSSERLFSEAVNLKKLAKAQLLAYKNQQKAFMSRPQHVNARIVSL